MDPLKDTSKEVREVLGKPPSWIIRAGTSTVIAGALALFLMTGLISYNDIVVSNITVTSINPPVELVARESGTIKTIFVSQDELVEIGTPIAEIGNPADFNDVLWLKQLLEKERDFLSLDLDSLPRLFTNSLQLGDIQDEYVDYYRSVLNLMLYDSLAPNRTQIAIQSSQLSEHNHLLLSQQTKLKQFSQQLGLSKNQYDRNRALYQKGVISKSEFEEITTRYLKDQQEFESLRSSISLTKISISELESAMQRMALNDLTDNETIGEELKQHYQKLQNAITDYELKYILHSPITGIVNMMQVWEEFQTV